MKKEFVLLREGMWESILMDTYTFGVLILLLTLNYEVWEGHWYVTVCFLLSFYVFVSARAKVKGRIFHSKKDLIEYVESQL